MAPKPPLMVTAQLMPIPAVTTMEWPLLLLVSGGRFCLEMLCLAKQEELGALPHPGSPWGYTLCRGSQEARFWSCIAGRLHPGDSGKYLLKQHEWRAGPSATLDQLLVLAREPPLSASVCHRGSGPTGQAGT